MRFAQGLRVAPRLRAQPWWLQALPRCPDRAGGGGLREGRSSGRGRDIAMETLRFPRWERASLPGGSGTGGAGALLQAVTRPDIGAAALGCPFPLLAPLGRPPASHFAPPTHHRLTALPANGRTVPGEGGRVLEAARGAGAARAEPGAAALPLRQRYRLRSDR